MAEHWDTITESRIALADQLGGLSAEQWATPSLCAAWTVKDVAAHLVMPLRSWPLPKFTVAFVVGRGNFDRANEFLTGREAARPTADLVADLRRHASSRFRPPGFGSEAPLTDVLVHGQDIRIPLGLVEDRPPEIWRPVLDFLLTPKARLGFVPRPPPALFYRATDLDWSHGSGDEVAGLASALALTLLGRPVHLDDLVGPGAGVLRAWVAR